MKAAVISFVLLPLVLMAWTTRRFGFRILHTLVASVVGEVLGLFLYAFYKQEKVALILSGKASGAVTYVGTEAPRGMVEAVSQVVRSRNRDWSRGASRALVTDSCAICLTNVAPDKHFSVARSARSCSFSAEPPRVLFTIPDGLRAGSPVGGTFAITPDDQRFLMVRDNKWEDMAGTPTLVVVQNLFDELRAKLKR